MHTIKIRQCVLMLENIEIYIKYSNYNIRELFNLLSSNKSIDKLDFVHIIFNRINTQDEFANICDSVFKDNKLISYFSLEEVDLLKGFFSCLGQTDMNGQISNCETYKELFKRRLDILEAQEKIKCKSQIAISLGLGLILSILIL